ncbi:predicted protein [Micromonas commoda]|uniref:PDZ domain-containing protein n=1 Tax=Micromonas commoda (strain RCC299 / NOUM17 / CCMP2709) TaxID=296587 RepID=C1EIM8_MICCC|nr:predicted protein [Micromonas commoda]ACO67707.1 predicted protein [Micromonas commoda]|eukprot:XP_002506449.1 predicted protein [Micromonas commoda]
MLRGAAGKVIVSTAAAAAILLGAPVVTSTLLEAVPLGVPAAHADEDIDERASNAFESAAEKEKKADAVNSTASEELTDLQIVEEVWKVVDDNFLPARSVDGFDRAAWAKLREDFVRSPPADRDEAYDTIRSILRTLGDPFSRFVEPSDFAPLLKYDISGVGMNVAEDPDDSTRLRVLGLVLDSPAAKAGVKQGDEVVAVDGVEVRNKSAFQAVSLIQASPGPDVKVTIRSDAGEPGAGPTRDVTLRRSSNAVNPVASRLEGGNVGYIRLKEFNALAEPNVAKAIESLRSQGATSFMLDLRDNPGGLVQAGVEIARLFLPSGVNVAYTEGRLKSIPSASATAPATEPLVVLVNGRSASASEILTGALKDNCRATVAGSKTYGKGLIQSVYELSDGSGLVLTVGKYVTPGLNDIDRQGITPNFAMFPGFQKAQEELGACERPSGPR